MSWRERDRVWGEAGSEETRECSEVTVTGSHIKALLEEIAALSSCCLHLFPGLWSSGGLAGHHVPSVPL